MSASFDATNIDNYGIFYVTTPSIVNYNELHESTNLKLG